jgi:hypothetical protein
LAFSPVEPFNTPHSGIEAKFRAEIARHTPSCTGLFANSVSENQFQKRKTKTQLRERQSGVVEAEPDDRVAK